MSRLFLLGLLTGLAGLLAGAHFYPWVQHERLPAETSVVANGGRAETFIVRLPVDRIAGIASAGVARTVNFPAGVEAPVELSGAPLSIEEFKVRATNGAVIGVASRHWTDTPAGPALAWSVTIPARGTVLLAAPGPSTDVLESVLQQVGHEAGKAWSGTLEVAAVPDRNATRTIASTQEFQDLDMQFTETWSITGVSADGELRGTIVLDTIGRRGS